MLRLAEVVRQHGPAYIERHRGSILPSHVRALQSIVHCRTPILGGHVAVCAACGTEHLLYHSCRHRACPRCGHDATSRWIARQRDLLLPVKYFHVVFTLPDELRRLVRAHQKTLIPALFRAAFDSLAALAADPHYLGAEIGALAVLHTWTRTLEWHPHIHMLVPGGGLAPDGVTWKEIPRRRKLYLVPVKALAKRFRRHFCELIRRALPGVSIPEIVWDKNWVVFAKPALQGAEKVVEYLGRYVHKTAIADGAIASIDDRAVTFRYRDNRDQCQKVMTLRPEEFLRRFLQHVLLRGMHRTRAFGLLHPSHRTTLRRLQLLLRSPDHALPESTARPRPRCPHCKERQLLLLVILSPATCIELVAAAHPWTTGPARAPPSLASLS